MRPKKHAVHYLQEFSEIERTRTLTQSENLQKKLFVACMQEVNVKLQLCHGIANLIENGLSNPNFTGMSEFQLRDYYQSHGWPQYGNISLSGQELSPVEVIFTNPKSQAYCVQSLYIDQLVPQPRTYDGYPQNDVSQLLKFRLEDDTFICSIPFPDYFKPSDIAFRIGKLLNGTPKIYGKNNPAFTSFKTIFETIAKLTAAYPHLTLVEAGKEILNTRLRNVSMTILAAEIIEPLVNISRLHLLLGTEPVRLGWADTLRDVSTVERLWAVARTSECDIRFILDTLKKKVSANYLKLGIDNDNSFDSIKDNNLRTLNFLLHVLNGNVTAALQWFNTCPFELPTYDENTQILIEADGTVVMFEPVALQLSSYREPQLKTLEISLRAMNPHNKAGVFYRYTHDKSGPRATLTDTVKQAINDNGHLQFILTCKTAQLILNAKKELKINLGMLERPKSRSQFDARQKSFVHDILRQSFEGDLSPLFRRNATTNVTAVPVNAYELLLLTSNIDPVLYLDIVDQCTPLSPLSRGFQPTHDNHYELSFGYDIASIHNRIFRNCQLENAAALMHAFNNTYAVRFVGVMSVFNKCAQLAQDSHRNEVHDFLVGVLPDNYHEYEHDFENSMANPALWPVFAASLMLTMAIAMYCFRRTLFGTRKTRVAAHMPDLENDLQREPLRSPSRGRVPQVKLIGGSSATGSRFFKPAPRTQATLPETQSLITRSLRE